MFSYFFPPIGSVQAKRVSRFVRYLADYGWDAVVVASRGGHWASWDSESVKTVPQTVPVIRFPAFDHPGITHRAALVAKGLEAWKTFQESRRWTDRLRRRLEAFDRNHLCFPDDKNWWAANVRWHFRSLIKRFNPDVLWSTGDPWSNLVLTHTLSRQTGLPAVADVRDPWTWHPHRYWSSARHQRLEHEVLCGHAHVVTVTEGFRRRYLELYPELAGRIHLIRNGYEEADVAAPKPALSPVKIHYLGSLTTGDLEDVRKRTLFLFLKALRILREQQTPGADCVRVKVAGHNVIGSQKLVDQFGLNDQVSILGNLSHAEARALRVEADILLHVDMLYENHNSSFVAAKVYEYLAANRPILALVPEGSEAGDIILQKNRGVVCRVDDVESICAGLRKMLAGDFKYDPHSDISEFSCRHETRQLADLLGAVAPR